MSRFEAEVKAGLRCAHARLWEDNCSTCGRSGGEKRAPTGCIRCGAQASHVLHPLELVACGDCYLLWIRDESLSVEAVEKVVGKWTGAGPYREHCKRFDAELLKRTTEWAKKARAA